MNSVASSTDAEDWLDISETLSLPSLSLDDVLNEVSLLDDEPFSGGLSECAGVSPSPVSIPTNYKLDNAVKKKRLESISHQLLSSRLKNGSAVAVAYRCNRTAVATSKGSLLVFDAEGRLERFWSGGESDGSASCVTFSEGGKYVAVGYSKGFVKVITMDNQHFLNNCILFKVISMRTGAVEELIKEAVQMGRGVLQVLYLDSGRTILTLDSGGSVFEMHTRHRFRLGKSRIRCIFSGCNGEVLHMRLLPHSLLALLTVSKILIVSTRMGGSIVCVFPLEVNMQYPPLLDYIEQLSEVKTNGERGNLCVCVGRGQTLNLFKLVPRNIGTPQKAAILLHKIHLPQMVVNLCFLSHDFLVAFDEKGSCMSIKDSKCITQQNDSGCRISLFFSTSDYKGLATGGNVSPAMQCLAERACYQSLCRNHPHNSATVLSYDELFELSLLTEEDQMELFQSRGDYVSACLYLLDIYRGRVRVDKRFRERLPEHLTEQLRRLVDFAMGGCKEGKVSELVAHYKVMLTCKQNGLYDGIIYVMNQAFGDYLSPLE
ncbi:hypothetical protein NECAME_04006, partial [Necator americanus]